MSLRKYLRRRRLDRDRAAEMQSHLDLAIQHYINQGLSPGDARRKARLRFGNPRAHREGIDDMNRLPLFDTLGRDLRYALRRLRQAPAFSATVIATLALTVGAAGAVFSLADAVLFRGLPFAESDRLAVLGYRQTTSTGEYIGASVDGAMWTAARDHASSIDTAISGRGAQGVNLTIGNTPSFAQNQTVGDGYFRVLGVVPQQGREFVPEEAQPGGPAVVILAHQFWQRVLGGAANAVGTTIQLRGEPHTVVGIMPAGFEGLSDADVWTPLRRAGQGLNYMVIARPRPGVTTEAANAELASLGDGPFINLRPAAEGTTRSLVLQNLHDTLTDGAREPIQMLGWAVAAVLLIACVNITALLMARSGTRTKEIATRMALGGGRLAVIRQLMVESLVLALVGGALGLAVAAGGLELLRTVGSATFQDWARATLDWRTAVTSFGLAGLASVLFGLLPAWQTSRIDVQSALTTGGSRSIAGGSRHIARRLLVVAEVAVGVVVLVAAGLLVRQFLSLHQLDPGFSPTNLYSVSASLQDARYKDPVVVNRLFSRSIEQLQQTSGIDRAAVSQGLPYQRLLNMAFAIEGRPDDGGRVPIANIGYVTRDFFDTFAIDLARGRQFDDRDNAATPAVAVVNEAFARFYFPDEVALGRRLLFGETPIEIVGISRDVQQGGAGFFLTGMQRGPVSTSPTIYVPAAQTDAGLFAWFSPVWTVRARSAGDAASALATAIGHVDPLLPLSRVESMEQVVADAMAQPRLMATLVGALALAALLLSAIGIHGLIAHVVAERTREFGIRLALGATVQHTIVAIARSGVVLASIGAIVGIALSQPAVTVITSFLYTVTPGDPTTYVVVGTLFVVVACLSSVIPALRLLRLDPATTLRE